MNIQQEELERLDLEGTDIQDAEATIEMVAEESGAQAPEVPVMEVATAACFAAFATWCFAQVI
ncbi:MAG: hypothetical protein SPL78_02505 [Bacteroidales bacterium]|nr:hypothetical protein [Bacteroidales bacterium]